MVLVAWYQELRLVARRRRVGTTCRLARHAFSRWQHTTVAFLEATSAQAGPRLCCARLHLAHG